MKALLKSLRTLILKVLYDSPMSMPIKMLMNDSIASGPSVTALSDRQISLMFERFN